MTIKLLFSKTALTKQYEKRKYFSSAFTLTREALPAMGILNTHTRKNLEASHGKKENRSGLFRRA
ncbi:MAG: hypothetical protein LRZ85_02845 [Alphaproteobacteria bacterium]|nr:hypothetical protein [Alphaproteobacteria bacterium]MCD8520282.1 hypothetical protein [Alphaproteobacteria bacterium]MCD8526250.1 hypothetical protein [Alphaproteobacteria bacterium]MCD8570201.1 hypothetical protein [Alphaproteobacteria bacterium]